MSSKLSDFFVYMLVKKPFYGRMASSMQRVARPGLGTMAIGIRGGRVTLFYDPAFLEGMDEFKARLEVEREEARKTAGDVVNTDPTYQFNPYRAAAFVLEHEMLHAILDHIPRYLELLALCPTDKEKVKAGAVYNVAMDAPINSMLRKHEGFPDIVKYTDARVRAKVKEMNPEAEPRPEDGIVLPEKWDLPLDGMFEDYQWVLMSRVQLIEIALQCVGGSNHQMWVDGDAEGENEGKGSPGEGEGDKKSERVDIIFGQLPSPGASQDELLSQANRAREALKDMLRRTIRAHGAVGRGVLPGNLEEWLEEYLRDPVVPWWEIFMTRARMSRASKLRRSVALPNRVLLGLAEEDDKIIPTPGRMRDKSWRVFLMVDTSGSMSTESLEIAKSELHHMLCVDENMEVRYMEGDAAVHFDKLLKTGDEIPKGVHGRGGTDFNSYFVYMKQYIDKDEAPDIVVVYTDGYAPPVTPDNRLPAEIPVIWLVTPEHSDKFTDDYGEIIVCDPEHNERHKAAA